MAQKELLLNPKIETLQQDDSALYDVYVKLLKGFSDAAEYKSPDFTKEPYSTIKKNEDGSDMFWEDAAGVRHPVYEPNQDAINQKIAEDAEIQKKNSAYLFASMMSRTASLTTPEINLTDYIHKDGDLMKGCLSALNGFEAGHKDQKILETLVDGMGKKFANVTGSLRISNDAEISGKLKLPGFTVYDDSGMTMVESEFLEICGEVEMCDLFRNGMLAIGPTEIYNDTHIYYHAGNSNKIDVDWTMGDGYVNRDLNVRGELYTRKGFWLGAEDEVVLYGGATEDGEAYACFNGDIDLVNGKRLMFDAEAVLSLDYETGRVVFDRTDGALQLGGNSSKILLESGLFDGSGVHKLIDPNGSGHFVNGFKASASLAGQWVLSTFSNGYEGVVVRDTLAIGSEDGFQLRYNNSNYKLTSAYPYIGGAGAEQVGLLHSYFANDSNAWHGNYNHALHLDIPNGYFAFESPIESSVFIVKSSQHKTRLQENTLFLREDAFIEGLADGIAIAGNTHFRGNLQSLQFSSGFAGNGWGVIKNEHAGAYHATFDELTIRKKMRVYELEVQRASSTNGSLWISNSCSGDVVEEVT